MVQNQRANKVVARVSVELSDVNRNWAVTLSRGCSARRGEIGGIGEMEKRAIEAV